MNKITISLIKADVGGYPGHVSVHPKLIEIANESLRKTKESSNLLVDYSVMAVGDDLQLLLSHRNGVDNKDIHKLAWDIFKKATDQAKKLKLYGAGQDLLKNAFSGNIRGLGPGIAEMEFSERESEPLIAFMMDKTEPGSFNLPLFKIFSDPFNTAGLIIDPNLHDGFRFEIIDIINHKKVMMHSPREMYDILALIGSRSRYVIKHIYPAENSRLPQDEPVAVVSTEKLYQIAGKYVGKDDPVALVRAQSGLPAVGEVLEPFSFPYLVAGWMRGSHNGPIMPVSFNNARCTRFDGPPRVVAAGFQISDGYLIGPLDLFDDPAFDLARDQAINIADYMRRHGPFEPHRLPMEEMEYTTLPNVLKKLEDRFSDVE